MSIRRDELENLKDGGDADNKQSDWDQTAGVGKSHK